MTYALRIPIESAVQKEAIRDIVGRTLPFVLKELSPEDMVQPMTGTRYEEVDQIFKESAVLHDVVRLRLWNREGRVIYSTMPSQVGRSYPHDEQYRMAIQGQQAWDVNDQSEFPEERVLGQLIEVYAPVTWYGEAGTPAGVLEVYLSYAPYARHLTSVRNAIFASAVLMSLALGTALCVLYHVGWRSILREREMVLNREREVSALNRLLQADLAHYDEVQNRLLGLRDEVLRRFPSVEGGMVPAAADAWLVIQIRDLATFATDVMNTPAQEEPGRRV
ncbi:MAG: hypothetical protein HY672_00385 [Chloroflexi bacterium]|nr:hypothetical protein [Chloroflexota bacterium]